MNHRVEFKKIIKASRAKVFAAWTDPQLLKLWYAPWQLECPKVTSDLRVGGRYEVFMEGFGHDGKPNNGSVSGTYREIIPNELLVFTFKGTWRDSNQESVVTVRFKDVNGGTELTLVHEQAESEDAVQGFKRGWESSTEKLSQLLSK